MSVFSPDRPGEVVRLNVNDRPSPGAEARRRFFRIRPAAGRHLESDHRVASVSEFNDGTPLSTDIGTPEVDAARPRVARSGTPDRG